MHFSGGENPEWCQGYPWTSFPARLGLRRRRYLKVCLTYLLLMLAAPVGAPSPNQPGKNPTTFVKRAEKCKRPYGQRRAYNWWAFVYCSLKGSTQYKAHCLFYVSDRYSYQKQGSNCAISLWWENKGVAMRGHWWGQWGEGAEAEGGFAPNIQKH